ncbi:oxygenase MpaB family protein [Segniliparus rugosus]|uniref:ER-bound oxygenase mpaB/mpaB'/Rubber oxygenase catalytic domain-containing protein n=1 Tax=Segniliparus rugosus (strain ATCC BAA-974 / DSM 45345 / CCUG 50838 / CIP 108380 / JCM 13579 / CDC 945) TaxID=679197 RepID=E5XS33_SEGRC|nr:oxygenase MpaB family protein [Segniliparus rugosus]EFV12818.1 hypothetical protein HMPREF9336_02305 [Segniliparus rugosus ATCC BAA-974]
MSLSARTSSEVVEHADGIGPGSLLWQLVGDSRIAYAGGMAGVLQTMHPVIGQALVDHSDFFDDPMDRVFRSLPGIVGVVYDDPGAQTGHMVRDFHKEIKGTFPDGRRYHSLDPATYWWAHATFQVMAEHVADVYSLRPLTGEERERLYQEGVAWYRRYGVSDAPVPKDRAAFQVEWERHCAEVLQPNQASDWLLKLINGRVFPKIGRPAYLPFPESYHRFGNAMLRRSLVRKAIGPPLRLSYLGGLPKIVRERFGIEWTESEERQYWRQARRLALEWRVRPVAWRWYPRAYQGWERATGSPPPRSASR